MKRLFCIISLLFILGNACAQQAPYYLNNAVTPPPPFENLPSFALDIFPLYNNSSDTVWLLGSKFYDSNNYDFFLFKYNIKNGVIEEDFIENIVDTSGLELAKSYSYYQPLIIGNSVYFIQSLIENNTGRYTYLLKADNNGEISWIASIFNSTTETGLTYRKKNNENKIIVLGKDYMFNGHNPNFVSRFVLNVVDTTGNILSTKYSSQVVGLDCSPRSLVETESGVIAIGLRKTTGFLPSPASVYPSPGVAVLFRNNGTQKVLKVGREDVVSDLPLYDIAQRNETEYLIRTKRSDTLQYYYKDAIMCIDSALNVKWVRTLDSTDQWIKAIGGILKTQDDNYVINGLNPNIDRINEYGMYGTFYDPFLYKIDSAARYIWKRNIVYNDLFVYQRLGKPYELPDGGFLMFGTLKDIAGLVETPFQKMWVVRTDKYGCLVPGCELWDDIDEKEADAAKISYYPNPFQHELYIFNPAHHLFYKGQIIDLSGKVVKNDIQLAPQTTTIVPLAHLSRGVYILTLINDEGKVQSHKIIKN